MNAKIDIKTPAGKSLEGFPVDLDYTQMYPEDSLSLFAIIALNKTLGNIKNIQVHKGDTITIEIL